jgi:hypothetical protein
MENERSPDLVTATSGCGSTGRIIARPSAEAGCCEWKKAPVATIKATAAQTTPVVSQFLWVIQNPRPEIVLDHDSKKWNPVFVALTCGSEKVMVRQKH